MKPKDAAELRCSFCTKAHAEVKKLIAGPNDVAICDECGAKAREAEEEGQAAAVREVSGDRDFRVLECARKDPAAV